MRLFARIAISLLAGTLPAGVSAAMAGAAAHPGHPKGPNDIICKDLPTSGSRLDAQRVCMTRLQWEDLQRATRQTIEKAQTQQVNAH